MYAMNVRCWYIHKVFNWSTLKQVLVVADCRSISLYMFILYLFFYCSWNTVLERGNLSTYLWRGPNFKDDSDMDGQPIFFWRKTLQWFQWTCDITGQPRLNSPCPAPCPYDCAQQLIVVEKSRSILISMSACSHQGNLHYLHFCLPVTAMWYLFTLLML